MITKEEAARLKALLPSSWAVVDDGSQLFRDTVCGYLNTFKNLYATRATSEYIDHYYGINGIGTSYSRIDIPEGATLLTLQLFTKLFNEALNYSHKPTPTPQRGKITMEQAVRLRGMLDNDHTPIQVEDDGSKLFRETVVDYMIKLRSGGISPTRNGTSSAWYSITTSGQVNKMAFSSYTDAKTFTLSEFVKLYDQVISNTTTDNNSQTKTQESGSNKTKGQIAEIQRITGTVTTGQRPTGTTVSGRGCKTAVEVGHLSNRACSV